MMRQLNLDVTWAALRKLPAVRRVLDELSNNERAKWGVIGIVLTLLLLVYLALYDGVKAEKIALIQRRSQIARLESIAEDREWLGRKSAVEGLRTQLEGRLWVADTDGLALADFQDWISRMGRDSGVPALQIRPEIDTNTNNPLSLRKMSASVSGAFETRALHEFMGAIARSNRIVSVDRIHVQTAPINRFDMTLFTYLRPRGGTGAITETSAPPSSVSPK